MSCSCEDACDVWSPVFRRGETWRKQFRWLVDGVAVNLTGWTASATITKQDGSVLHSATVANGEIVMGGTAGTVTAVVPDDVTATFVPRRVRFTLAAISPSGETKYFAYNLEGAIT